MKHAIVKIIISDNWVMILFFNRSLSSILFVKRFESNRSSSYHVMQLNLVVAATCKNQCKKTIFRICYDRFRRMLSLICLMRSCHFHLLLQKAFNRSHIKQFDLIVAAKIRKINAKKKSFRLVRSFQILCKTHAVMLDCQFQFKTSTSRCRQSTFNRFTRRKVITTSNELINHLKNESIRNWSCSMNQWHSIVCCIDCFTNARISTKTKKSTITTFENFRCFEVMNISSKYCCFFSSILLFCRLRLEIAVSSRTMIQVSKETSDLAKKVKRHTIRSCWSSCEKHWQNYLKSFSTKFLFSF